MQRADAAAPAGGSGGPGIKGTYVLDIEVCQELTVNVGRQGPHRFRRGHYYYVGSARAGIRARVQRHLGHRRRLFWHVDYLLAAAGVRVQTIWVGGLHPGECQVAHSLAAEVGLMEPVARFGAGDCGCPTHLFRVHSGTKRAAAMLAGLGLSACTPGMFAAGVQEDQEHTRDVDG